MNNASLYILTLLVFSNMVSMFLKSPIRVINVILLLQFGLSYLIGDNYLGGNNMLVISSNILIDMIALTIITHFYRKAFKENRKYKVILDGILSAILMMFLTHLLVCFDMIKTFEVYYTILNSLSLICVILGFIGGIMGAINGMVTNKDSFNSRVFESNRINRGVDK